MPHTACRVAVFAACALGCAALARAADEHDQFEDKTVVRCAERALRAGKNDRGQWIRELEAAFPDKVVHALTDDEYATWFALLAGKNEEWKREDAPSTAVAELFDKVVQRLELGPVPSIKKDEFMKYARNILKEQNPRPGNGNDPGEEADKVFRVLDRNADGELAPEEYTAGLKEEKVRADADGNGRITKDEYRGYFLRKVTVKTESLAAKGGDPLTRPNGKGKGANGLPEWFNASDADKDGQVELYEWRKAGRPVAQFNEMDLNGDGVLTRDEYLRFVKQNDDKLKAKMREDKQSDPDR